LARRTTTIIISDPGRDKDKYFLLTEKPAMQAEKWAIRALQAAVKAGVNIPDDMISRGMATVFAIGIQTLAGMNFSEAEPLMDELMECVKIIRDPKHPEMAFPLIPGGDDIEEITTVARLQREVIQLHINFSIPAVPSTLSSIQSPASPSTNTKTSPPRSARPSPRKALRL
jgi:hypothetical protein